MHLIETNKPWYSYPLVWMMVLIPFSAVIMGVVMIWLAIDTDDGLVADDYYKQGMEINRVIERDKKAAELELSAVIELDSNARIIHMRFNKGLLDYYPRSLTLNIQHATRENSDLTVLLDHGIGDRYIGHLKQNISLGIWYFEIADTNWKLKARTYVRSSNTIVLQSKY